MLDTPQVSRVPDRWPRSNRTNRAIVLGKTTERMFRRKAELRPAALCVSVRNVFPCCADRAEATIGVVLSTKSHASGAGAVALSCFPVFRKEFSRRFPAVSVKGTNMPTPIISHRRRPSKPLSIPPVLRTIDPKVGPAGPIEHVFHGAQPRGRAGALCLPSYPRGAGGRRAQRVVSSIGVLKVSPKPRVTAFAARSLLPTLSKTQAAAPRSLTASQPVCGG